MPPDSQIDPLTALVAVLIPFAVALFGEAKWRVISIVLGRVGKLLTVMFGDKRSTKEHPAVGSNGTAALTAVALEDLDDKLQGEIRSLRDEVAAAKAEREAIFESLKALEKRNHEMQEFWRKELREFKLQQTIDTGRSIAKRTSEIEGELAQQATAIQVATLDTQHYSNAILSSIEIMTTKVTTSLDTQQESFNEMIDLFKEFVKRVQPVQAASLAPPSADLIAAKRESVKHITDEIKPPDIKPDVHKPAKEDAPDKPGSDAA